MIIRGNPQREVESNECEVWVSSFRQGTQVSKRRSRPTDLPHVLPGNYWWPTSALRRCTAHSLRPHHPRDEYRTGMRERSKIKWSFLHSPLSLVEQTAWEREIKDQFAVLVVGNFWKINISTVRGWRIVSACTELSLQCGWNTNTAPKTPKTQFSAAQ